MLNSKLISIMTVAFLIFTLSRSATISDPDLMKSNEKNFDEILKPKGHNTQLGK